MYSLLNTIHDPKVFKSFDKEQLNDLTKEIRQFVLDHVSVTGGHLASNLGVVELTLSLHYVFDSPRDQIIWDVGHQSYVHKILTQRRDEFKSLRQYGGISGFPKRAESAHDIFETGHSSTSISAALGIARARDIKGEVNHVLAVIGDAALSGGMAFEALNDAGHSNTNLIVILNDNEMSISQNVGALATHLSNIRSNPRYKWAKKEIEHLIKKIPLAGKNVATLMERIKNSLKYVIVPGVIFEEMGFTYMGPIDGHNLSSLITVMNRARKIQGPVFVHVITQKGKGYTPAEQDPQLYHGVSPFSLDQGCIKADKPCYSNTFGRHLVELAKIDPSITAITAAMPDGTGLALFRDQFPDRFFDVGIAEQHAVTLAAGLACKGLRPVVAIYSTFLQRAYDQILHDVCQQNLPVVFAIDRAGIVGEDGETHQGVFDISFMRHMPNIVLLAPKNTDELKSMLSLAVRQPGPCAIRYPRGNFGTALVPFPEPIHNLDWEILMEGQEIVLLAVGFMVEIAQRAATILAEVGFSPIVVNARVIKPLDTALLNKLSILSSNWFTLEDNAVMGGFGSGINEYVMEFLPHIRVKNIGIPDRFITHGSLDRLLSELELDSVSIAKRIKATMAAWRESSYAGK